MRRYLYLAIVAIALLLGACATDKLRSKQTVLDDTLRAYAATIRWEDIEQAQAFIDPALLRERPPTAFDLSRYRQVKISSYDAQAAVPMSETEVRQSVEIGVVNVNTQRVRSIVDRQVWRYDSEAKRWWLMSGLPDITRAE